ncbi:MAG TPA: DUF1634 domain-containing protein [Gemmatimonadales bacterium]|nr:DUF1634 domain-containing protein [Gemmatimonadales bacterium]
MASTAGSEPTPPPARPGWDDDRIERLLARLLQAGVLLSTLLVLAGGIVFLSRHGGTIPHYSRFEGEPAELSSVAGIIRSALGGDGRGLIQLGLLVLVATPVLRVAGSLVAFLALRDRTYVILTSVVLLLLASSLAAVVF